MVVENLWYRQTTYKVTVCKVKSLIKKAHYSLLGELMIIYKVNLLER